MSKIVKTKNTMCLTEGCNKATTKVSVIDGLQTIHLECTVCKIDTKLVGEDTKEYFAKVAKHSLLLGDLLYKRVTKPKI